MINLTVAALGVMENESPSLDTAITKDNNGFRVCFGINEQYYPDNQIFDAPPEKRTAIATDFYIGLAKTYSLDQLTSQALLNRILDAITDPGPGAAGKCLQQVINQYTGATDLVKIDSQIGPKTIKAVNDILKEEIAYPTEWRFLSVYREALCFYFNNRVLVDRNNLIYLPGWIKRVTTT